MTHSHFSRTLTAKRNRVNNIERLYLNWKRAANRIWHWFYCKLSLSRLLIISYDCNLIWVTHSSVLKLAILVWKQTKQTERHTHTHAFDAGECSKAFLCTLTKYWSLVREFVLHFTLKKLSGSRRAFIARRTCGGCFSMASFPGPVLLTVQYNNNLQQ